MKGEINTADGYSYNDIMQMQEQAIRRAREMQQRARITVAGNEPEENKTVFTEETASDRAADNPAVSESARRDNISGENRKNPLSGFYSILQKLPADDDLTVILPIIMMLLREGADEKLILALLYIMS